MMMLAVSSTIIMLIIIDNDIFRSAIPIADDFGEVSDHSLMFPAESPVGFRSCVNISISDDQYVENDEVFSVSIESSDAVNLQPNFTKTITIVNDDCEQILLFKNAYKPLMII